MLSGHDHHKLAIYDYGKGKASPRCSYYVDALFLAALGHPRAKTNKRGHEKFL